MISYADVDEFPGWGGARAFLRSTVVQEHATSILEVGSGANPTLEPTDLVDLGIERYTTNDVSGAELAKAPHDFETLQVDLSKPDWRPDRTYDLIFSRMVNEHIQDGRAYYANLFRALRAGGLTVHCFSTLWALPFAANRLLPESVASRLLDLTTTGTEHHEKFRAYYSWSRGPSRRSIDRFASVGFDIDEYVGYFGHGYYSKVRPLHSLERAKARFLAQHPVPILTSYAVVKLRRPAS
ncbi:MAG TPA: methyltransferase domain-containing protein [Acidimicrobiia bacterium]|nr:methyltransferase domain-containing protein [Acidimicrobiia bacterium]